MGYILVMRPSRDTQTNSLDVVFCVVMIVNVRAADEKVEKGKGWPPHLFLHLNGHQCPFCCSSAKGMQ